MNSSDNSTWIAFEVHPEFLIFEEGRPINTWYNPYHITVVYLGKTIPSFVLPDLADSVTDWFAFLRPRFRLPEGKITSWDRFGPENNIHVGIVTLEYDIKRELLIRHLHQNKIPYAEDFKYTPHISFGEGQTFEERDEYPFTLTRMFVEHRGERILNIPLV